MTDTELMTDIAMRYRRLAGEFTQRVESVPSQRWEAPSPCEDWTARQVLEHVVQTQHNVAGYVGRTLPDGPGVDSNPATTWTAAAQGMQALLDDPATAQLEFTGMSGPTTVESTVDQFLCFDLIVHGWDIARATGGAERIDPDEVPRILAQAQALGDALRMPGGFARP